MGKLIKENVYTNSNEVNTICYTYDISGNILERLSVKGNDTTAESYTYNAINQLTSLTKMKNGKVKSFKTFDYDVDGNMTGIRVGNGFEKQFTFNSRNMLIKYKDNKGNDIKYDYNAEDLRKDKYIGPKDSPTSKISFYYMGSKIINESQVMDGKNIMAAYLMAGNSRILRIVGPKKSQKCLQWLISNGKDIVGITDNKGKKQTKTYAYTPYGRKANYGDSSSS